MRASEASVIRPRIGRTDGIVRSRNRRSAELGGAGRGEVSERIVSKHILDDYVPVAVETDAAIVCGDCVVANEILRASGVDAG